MGNDIKLIKLIFYCIDTIGFAYKENNAGYNYDKKLK